CPSEGGCPADGGCPAEGGVAPGGGTLDSNVGEPGPCSGALASWPRCEQPVASAINAATDTVPPRHLMDRFIEPLPEMVARPRVQTACPGGAVRGVPQE